jgi:4-amino-4-deoxy-L-arabinose transferase-like glycosyltransferase
VRAEEHVENYGRCERRLVVLVATVLLLVVLICAAFSACGAAIVSGVALWTGTTAEPEVAYRTLMKAGLFVVLAAASGWGLRRIAKRLSIAPAQPVAPQSPDTQATWIAFGAVLLLAAALVVPNLEGSPKAEPDEMHHLIVARNLAEHGLYASGHPDTGFIVFDDYDSVGPPVIVPLAGAVRLAGNHLGRVRLVMAAFFLAFCVAAFCFLRPVFGPQAAVAGLALAVFANGSAYLGRSVYGEVPALLFLLMGLILWRRALAHRWGWLSGLMAGVAFCLAALCKYFIAMAFWPLLGAFIYDRLTFRRIRWPHLVFPAAGAVAALSVWCLIRAANTPETGDPAMAQMSQYQHLILFGLRPLASTLPRLVHVPLFAACLCLMVYAMPRLFRECYDLPAIALFLFVPFMLHWWLFFTPGHIMRYLWYGFACAGMLAGPAVWAALRGASQRGRHRALHAAAFLLVLAATLFESRGGLRQVFADEASDQRALAAYVRDLPPDASIATSSWPLKGLLNFMAGRNVVVLRDAPDNAEAFDVVLAEGPAQRALFGDRVPQVELGRFAVYTNKEQEPGS